MHDDIPLSPGMLRYQEEIEAFDALDSVMEPLSPPPTLQRAPQGCRDDKRGGKMALELSGLDVSIMSWSDTKGHTEYLISTGLRAQPAACVSVSRRFSGFVRLHDQICAPLDLERTFPVPKTPFVTDSVKRYRMRALQGYLRHALAATLYPRDAHGRSMPPSLVALSEFLGADALRPLVDRLEAEQISPAATSGSHFRPSVDSLPAHTPTSTGSADSADTADTIDAPRTLSSATHTLSPVPLAALGFVEVKPERREQSEPTKMLIVRSTLLAVITVAVAVAGCALIHAPSWFLSASRRAASD